MAWKTDGVRDSPSALLRLSITPPLLYMNCGGTPQPKGVASVAKNPLGEGSIVAVKGDLMLRWRGVSGVGFPKTLGMRSASCGITDLVLCGEFDVSDCSGFDPEG
jgi:hypothetical protein